MESVNYLNQNFPDLKGRIIAEDFLKLDLSKIFPGQFCVIGNYPYNISSQIFFKVLDYKDQIPRIAPRITVPGACRISARRNPDNLYPIGVSWNYEAFSFVG